MNFRFQETRTSWAWIGSSITDNGRDKVGLRMHGGHLILYSNSGNSFTGNVEVDDGVLSLQKENGAIAVKGNIFLRNHSQLHLDRSYQFSKTSNITMQDSKLAFSLHPFDREEHFHKMSVAGESGIDFWAFNAAGLAKRFLYLDDLVIDDVGQLTVSYWQDGLHRIFIRKDSEHIYGSLGRIVFEHDKTKKAGLRDYNKDYWEIGPGFPEPTTYGAIFASGALALVFWRRPANRQRTKEEGLWPRRRRRRGVLRRDTGR